MHRNIIRPYALFTRCLVLACCILCASRLFALESPVTSNYSATLVERINIPNLSKLPVNAIHRVYQDREGYMWYGTVNGLCRDDGHEVKVFRSDFTTPGILRNNLVECIVEDYDRHIWFGTDEGLYRLDKRDYSIHPVDHPSVAGKMIIQLFCTQSGNVWVAMMGGLHLFDSTGRLLWSVSTRSMSASPGKGATTHVNSLCQGRDGTIFVTLLTGEMFRVDERRRYVEPLQVLNDRFLTCRIVQDAQADYYWLISREGVMAKFNPQKPEAQQLVIQSQVEKAVAPILYMTQQPTTRDIWVTTITGLKRYACVNDELQDAPIDSQELNKAMMLNDIITDSHGNLWVAGFDTPSFMIDYTHGGPRYFKLPALGQNTPFRATVMALCPAGDDKMWLFQERVGVMLYNFSTNAITSCLGNPMLKTVPSFWVKEMSPSGKRGGVWLCREQSLQAYNLSSHDINIELQCTVDVSHLRHYEALTCLLESRDGRYLWMGTKKGLIKYDIKNKCVAGQWPLMGHVTRLVSTNSGDKLWIGTFDKGLYVMSTAGKMKHYAINRAITCLSLASNGHIWMGTDEGMLLQFNPKSRMLYNHSTVCHLNGDMINRVIVDEFTHVWVAGNQKIIEYNPKNHSYRSFLTTDAPARLWRYIPSAQCQDEEGNIYFGGISGICRFTPSEALERESRPAVARITDVVVDGHTLHPGEGGEPFSLEASSGRVEFFFSALNHRLAHKMRYAYKLEGIDEKWQYTAAGLHSAVYNKLPRGDYRFQVKTIDDNGLWSECITSLSLHRKAAWYESTWAYIIYTFIILFILYFVVRRIVSNVNKKNEELWADSEEMVHMRDYLQSTESSLQQQVQPSASTPLDFKTMDEVLLERATSLVRSNMSVEDFDVNQLSSLMNMSRSTFTRKIKAITGKTPLEFIRHIKMERAHELLTDQSRTVSDVALELGYSNRKSFSQSFKEEYGVTPSDYQRSLLPM